MTIIVEKFETLPTGARVLELSTESTTVSIYHGEAFSSVCVKNAAHRAYRGVGRTYHGERRFERAEADYKSEAVRSILRFAAAFLAPQQSN